MAMIEAIHPTTVFSGVTAFMAVVTGSVAVATLLGLRRDSRDRTRPVVSVVLVADPITDGLTNLVVENTGQSAAFDLQVTFDPPLPEDGGVIVGLLAKKYARTVPSLTPQARLTNIYAHYEGGELTEAVPPRTAATVTYRDARQRTYAATWIVDLDVMMDQTAAYPGGTKPDQVARRIARAAESIARGVGRY